MADLPVWAMDPAFVGFQAPPFMPLSLNWHSPWLPQMALPGPDQHRFVEVSEDSEGSAINEGEPLSLLRPGMCMLCKVSSDGAYQIIGPVVEEPPNMDFFMPWSFADMPAGTIEQWFDSI